MIKLMNTNANQTIQELRERLLQQTVETDRLRQELKDLQETTAGKLLFARCAKHLKVPQLNTNEGAGAECGVCIQEHASQPFGPADLNVEFRCIRCGRLTPWVCNHFVQPKSPEAPLLRNLCQECCEILNHA